MEITIQPISILNEFREIYGNKLLEELVELTIEENPGSGFFLNYIFDGDTGPKKGILQSFYLSGANNPEDLKKFFLGLSKDQHFFFADTIFKEDDHFDENHDLLKYYPEHDEGNVTEFLIRDFGNNPTDVQTRKRMREFIGIEAKEERLIFMGEDDGLGVYLKESEEFLESLALIAVG